MRAAGRLNAQSCVRRWQMDDVTFTYIVDGAMWIDARAFFPAIPAEYWLENPDAHDGNGRVAMSTGGLLVERDGHRLIIDAGLGDVVGDTSFGPGDCGEFLNVMHATGVAAEDVDVFALTHLHLDHTGWAFSGWQSGERLPTFPRAPYLVAEAEWAPLSHGQLPVGAPDADSVMNPLARHPGLTLIADGDEVAPGVVSVVTPGHSAGHTSYVVTSTAGRRLVAFGDAFHAPVQLRHPEWGSAPDLDPSAVGPARSRVLAELLQDETVGFAMHFGDQPFGRVVDEGGTDWQPIPTSVLQPPPR